VFGDVFESFVSFEIGKLKFELLYSLFNCDEVFKDDEDVCAWVDENDEERFDCVLPIDLLLEPMGLFKTS
jgi:hypothetical protein